MINTNENQNDIKMNRKQPTFTNTSQSKLEKLNHNSHYNIACDQNNKKNSKTLTEKKKPRTFKGEKGETDKIT
jgi:hypothetical protein